MRRPLDSPTLAQPCALWMRLTAGYPFLVLTFVGWIWTLVKGER
ncbi:hypothetical protein [Mesorhizobium sp. M1396]